VTGLRRAEAALLAGISVEYHTGLERGRATGVSEGLLEGIAYALQLILDSLAGTPAFVLNGRLDVLADNRLGHALYSPMYADPVRPANAARFVFLDPHSREFWRDWSKAANHTANLLRAEAGRDPTTARCRT
jgi:transcriptional regulator with XRE-family HTH domain